MSEQCNSFYPTGQMPIQEYHRIDQFYTQLDLFKSLLFSDDPLRLNTMWQSIIRLKEIWTTQNSDQTTIPFGANYSVWENYDLWTIYRNACNDHLKKLLVKYLSMINKPQTGLFTKAEDDGATISNIDSLQTEFLTFRSHFQGWIAGLEPLSTLSQEEKSLQNFNLLMMSRMENLAQFLGFPSCRFVHHLPINLIALVPAGLPEMVLCGIRVFHKQNIIHHMPQVGFLTTPNGWQMRLCFPSSDPLDALNDKMSQVLSPFSPLSWHHQIFSYKDQYQILQIYNQQLATSN